MLACQEEEQTRRCDDDFCKVCEPGGRRVFVGLAGGASFEIDELEKMESSVPVFGSSLASFKPCTISVMLLIVPFLTPQDLLATKTFPKGATDILKFPPTKNWRPMIAVKFFL